MYNKNDVPDIDERFPILPSAFLKKLDARLDEKTGIWYWYDNTADMWIFTDNGKTMLKIYKIIERITRTFGVLKNDRRLDLRSRKYQLNDSFINLSECSVTLIEDLYMLLKDCDKNAPPLNDV